ncbi:hypothetical protein NIES4071_50450 [Calothrix sp. NIES-4071]|nr:hypothetical protein NIES4071_50450 [Calothrix sp. NIES-4071]BAZ59352.1 hypothetical protein NIES4105_50390 [Calothrix sp. NIES-4105]
MSRYCLKTIKSFGFTQKMIDQYLGQPTIVNNPHYKCAAPMKLWERDLVDKVREEKKDELEVNLAKRAKILEAKDKRKSAKRSLLGFYLENYSYKLNEYYACRLIEIAFKTGAISISVFESDDLTINSIAGYLADEEEARIRKEFAASDKVYTKVYPLIKDALKSSELVLECVKNIQNIIEDWEREEQQKAEKQKLERLRIKLIQQSFFEYIEQNFDSFFAYASINPNAIQEPGVNASKKKNKQLKRNVNYVWSRIQNYARSQNPNFANAPTIPNCGKFYQQISSYVNRVLQEKQEMIKSAKD